MASETGGQSVDIRTCRRQVKTDLVIFRRGGQQATSASIPLPRRRGQALSAEGGENVSGGRNFDGTRGAAATGTPCGSATDRFVISGCNLLGQLSSGTVSPRVLRRPADRLGFELDQYRSLLGENWFRFLRAIRWMHRMLDRLKTVIANLARDRDRRAASQAIPAGVSQQRRPQNSASQPCSTFPK